MNIGLTTVQISNQKEYQSRKRIKGLLSLIASRKAKALSWMENKVSMPICVSEDLGTSKSSLQLITCVYKFGIDVLFSRTQYRMHQGNHPNHLRSQNHLQKNLQDRECFQNTTHRL